MSKVRNFAELAPNIGFSEFDFYDLYRSTFEKSELGRMKKLLPLHAMAENFGLVSKSIRPKLGRKPYFTPEGKVALMFLKMYTRLSCPKLMEQLNGNIHYQIFCDVIIDPTHPLTNYKLLDDIMLELAGKLKIQQLQDILAEQWKPYMQNLDTLYTDATCYESEMRYPTDPKLLWEGIEKSYETMCELSKSLGTHRPRTKFIDVQKANLTQGEWDTDIVREARKAVQRGEEGKRHCQKGTCPGEGDSDGGLVRHTERALRPKAGQGPDEADGNPVHVLRHSHGKRGAAGRQNRAESTAGGLLKRKYAHRNMLHRGTTPLS